MFRPLLLLLLLFSMQCDLVANDYRPSQSQGRLKRYRGRQHVQLNLKREMTPDEFRRTGLEKLTMKEVRTLEQWVTRWHVEGIRDEFDSYKVLVVDSIERSGMYVRLSDGSKWKISPFSVRLTRHWDSDQRVRVDPGQAGSYKLKNLRTGDVVVAELTSGTPTTGEKGSSGGVQLLEITSIGRGGDTFTLEDGSVWKIPLRERKETRVWRIGQQVEFQDEVQRGQSVIIYNIDTNDQIESTLLYGPRRSKEKEEELDEQQDLYEDGRQGRDEPLYRKENLEE